MNPLDNYPKARKVVYQVFWLWGLGLVGWQVAVGAIDNMVQPTPLTVMLAIYPATAAYVGYTAARNTPANGDDEGQ